MRVKSAGRRRQDSAELAHIEYIGNKKEIEERQEEEEMRQNEGRPEFWEFSRNVTRDEVTYYKKAIAALKAKIQDALIPENSDKKYGNLNAKQYVTNCRQALKVLQGRLQKAEADLKIFDSKKNHRMFRNCDQRYATPLIRAPLI